MIPLRTAVGVFEEPDYRVALIVCLVFTLSYLLEDNTVFSRLANNTHYSQKILDVPFSGEMHQYVS